MFVCLGELISESMSANESCCLFSKRFDLYKCFHTETTFFCQKKRKLMFICFAVGKLQPEWKWRRSSLFDPLGTP